MIVGKEVRMDGLRTRNMAGEGGVNESEGTRMWSAVKEEGC